MVKWLNKALPTKAAARRVAEGGSKDIGDIEWIAPDGEHWIGECKATQTLNVTRVLSKARLKSPLPDTTVLFWKRLSAKKPGQSRRTPDGEPIVVVMALDTFNLLIGEK